MISYPNRKLVAFFLGLFLLQGFLEAQDPVTVERTNNKVILEGTVYYIHTVKPGETLYAISKAYNISQKAIAIENPGIISGIRIGQALKIPVNSEPLEEIDTSELVESSGTAKYHMVQPGETLYGIARLYGLKETDLRQANPNISAESLRPGQSLRIPENVVMEEEHSYNEEGLLYHKVKKKETLYSIAAYYDVSVDEIRLVNPELGWGGPKADQILRIPAPQLTDQQEAVEDIEAEFYYAAAEEESKRYDYDELDTRHENIRRTYRIAYLIPFDFREMEPLDTLLKDIESETRRNRIIERYLMEEKIPQSVHFLEFFQGTLLAIDSMRQTGMRLDVRFFDTRRSVVRTSTILQEEGLDDFDLILGPFYPYNLELVSAFSRQHRIPLVTPFHNDLDLIRNNPYLFQLSPSKETQYKEAAKLVASKHNYNIIYIRQVDSLNIERHDYFKQLIFDGFDDYHPSEPVVFKEVVLSMRRIVSLEETNEIIHSLSKEKKNLVLVPTSNVSLASPIVSTLRFQLKDYEIEVMGTPYWMGSDFSSIDYRDFHNLSLIFYSPFWIDYSDQKIEAFMAKYRDQYYNEPTNITKKGINYGILGHDMTLYFLNALRMYGRRFILDLDEYHPELVQGPYEFRRISESGGYENAHINFYQFMPDMSVQEFEVPPFPEKNFYMRPVEDNRKRRFLYREDVFN